MRKTKVQEREKLRKGQRDTLVSQSWYTPEREVSDLHVEHSNINTSLQREIHSWELNVSTVSFLTPIKRLASAALRVTSCMSEEWLIQDNRGSLTFTRLKPRLRRISVVSGCSVINTPINSITRLSPCMENCTDSLKGLL